ncbi:MAG: Ref family protein [Planctomycetes bacterium]|nr:Ref family protein [Planctomycetota bacterium]
MANLTGQPVYQKRQNRPKRGARQPNAEEKRHWHRLLKLPCVVGLTSCSGRITIHHCGTSAGGRKDHMRVIPLCFGHHLGPEGIDGKRMSKRAWQEKYGTETELLEKVNLQLKAHQ